MVDTHLFLLVADCEIAVRSCHDFDVTKLTLHWINDLMSINYEINEILSVQLFRNAFIWLRLVICLQFQSDSFNMARNIYIPRLNFLWC